MSDQETIRLEISEGVAVVWMARPKHNVLNIEMMKELNRTLESLKEDASLKCVVFRGDGASWCAGVDVGDHMPDKVDAMVHNFNRIFQLIDELGVPTIAAVHGACLGGGMEVAIACDIIVASKKAVFGQPEVKLGFFPPYAAIRLPELVGPARTIEICTTGRTFGADEALNMGMISQSVEPDQFESALNKMVSEIKASSPLILRLNKLAVKKHLGMNFLPALDGVGDLFLNTLMKTEDTLEGIAGFYEKRKPVWKNR